MSEGRQDLDEAAVLAYLAEHPDLLQRHPQLFETLELPHDAGEAASLIEYQVQVLRDRNHELQGRVRDYVQRAEENEALLRRVYEFCLAIAVIDGPEALVEDAGRRLERDFGCEFVALGFFDTDAPAGCVALAKGARDEFQPFLDQPQGVCGRLSKSRLRWLFDESELEQIESGALVSLGPPGLGVLALGSRDGRRFFPGMGTLFLELLAQMLGQRLLALDRSDAVVSD